MCEREREKERDRKREGGREREKEQEVRASSESSCGRALSVPHSGSMRDYYINSLLSKMHSLIKKITAKFGI